MRRLFAALLAAVGIAYAALLIAAYLQTTAPSALGPKPSDIRRLLHDTERPISPMERRLEASDTPLGTGPLISGESASEKSMRFAFTGQVEVPSKPLSSTELAEREGERQALLNWIRSGASRMAYEADDYALVSWKSNTPITPTMLNHQSSTSDDAPRVRIRSLINQRCVGCHVADDGDDTARLIPFDTYDSIAHYLVLDDHTSRGRAWLLAALGSLFPLAMLACPAFALTTYPRPTRRKLLSATIALLIIVAACWFAGPFLTPLLLVATVLAIVAIALQLLASASQLLSKQPL